jgi:membrane associated rhomboid family serine protease
LRAAASDAQRIADGQWWRPFTALTVHADVTHLLGNLVSLYFLGWQLCRIYGGGLGWLLILAGGAVGNAGVALLFREGHVAVGASTAGFAALGALAGRQTVRRFMPLRSPGLIQRRALLPIAAGLALLALLGAGERSDLTAHLFGFFAGVLLGAAAWLARIENLPDWVQRILQLAALTIVMLAWRTALHHAL